MATPENPRVRQNTRTLGPLGTAKVTPFPQPGRGAYKGALWGPVAEFATGQVAGNSNLKLGDTPRLTAIIILGSYSGWGHYTVGAK